MDKFNALMQRKVLGVKVLYLTAALVVALALVAWKMKSAGISPSEVQYPETDTGTDTDTSATDTSAGYDPDGKGTVTVSTTGTNTDTSSTVVETNETWQRKAIQWLIGQGNAIEISTSAIQKYLNGDQLSYAEGQLKDKAVRQFGLPPDVPTVGGTASKPTTPAKPVAHIPGTYYKVTGNTDNTYGKIAKLFYGSSDDKWIDLLQAANPKLGHVGGWKPGTTVNVPPKTEPRYFRAVKGRTTLAQIAAANGITQYQLKEYNDTVHFPVKIGTRVRVG